MKIAPKTFVPSAEECRVQAREKLGPQSPHLELAALEVFEASLSQLPLEQLKGAPDPEQLGVMGKYAANLAATFALGGPLAPAVLQALEGFDPEKILATPESQGKNQFRSFGSLEAIHAVNQVAGPARDMPVGGGHTVKLTGVLLEREVDTVTALLQEVESKVGTGVFNCLNEINLRTYLGEGSSGRVGGLAGDAKVPGAMVLENRAMVDVDTARHNFYHELGHLIDLKAGSDRAFFTAIGSTPFGKGKDPADFVSTYAQGNAWEDLAETHATMLDKWDKIQAAPGLWLHCTGAVGEKMAWILKSLYARAVPPAPEKLKEVQAGNSPFGWKLQDCTVVGWEKQLGTATQEVLKHWTPGQTIPPAMLDPTNPGWEQRRFVFELAGASPPPFPEGYHATRQSTAQLVKEIGFAGTHHSDSTLKHLSGQLQAGGPAVQRDLKQALDQQELDPHGPLHTIHAGLP